MTDALHNFTLDSVLEEHGRSYPGKTATVFGDTRHTFDELRVRVDRLANALQSVGVGAGDRVLWLGQNAHRVLELLLACARVGALFCPANWRQTAEELAFVLEDLEPEVVVWQDEEVGSAVRAGRERAAGHKSLWLQHDASGAGSYEAFLASAPATRREAIGDPTQPLLMLYTAAFDGRPCGAMLSQTAILLQCMTLARTQGVGNDTVFLNSGPLFHLGTMMSTLSTFVCGGTNVFVRRSDAATIAQAISNEHCTGGFLVGSTMEEIVALNAGGTYDLRSFRSRPYSPAWDAMVTPDPSQALFFGYGQTEAMGLVTFSHYAPGGIGRCGRPSPSVQLRVVDDTGNDVPAGQTGEIVLRGPLVMNGYWRRPEINAHRERDGWYHTNDLGCREADGTLTFVGPKVHMIKSGVENIYPAEVEGCLRQHPAVADCGVIGVPHERWIQTVKAIVALKPGATATEAELIEYCKARIASYKKPSSVAFVERIPRGPTGDVDHSSLDRDFGGGNYPGAGTRTT
ncbi:MULTISPECIES: AMP-binding protein [Burkholderia]|uniref:AMP-binding protein n=1 Tax=Burkholderia TaxID=32008 RepID=UPI00158D1B3A|nr:AMP-binding protein [Burkholderia seminalis]